MEGVTPIATPATQIPQPNKAEQQKSQFLKLLVAQLKGQNPLNPQDGAEFVTQLAQFSSLEELINIRTVLENVQKTLEKPKEEAPRANPFDPKEKA